MSDSSKLSLIMGARNGALENDFYATDPRALPLFLESYKERFSDLVLEPCCGNGILSECLKQYGYDVMSYDIVDRGYGKVMDFFDLKHWENDIVTNPPYKCATEIINHALDIIPTGRKVAMFLKIQFLESQNRYEYLFKNRPPKYVYVHSSRMNCAKNAEFERYKEATLCYCWFVWEKGFTGDTIIRWIK